MGTTTSVLNYQPFLPTGLDATLSSNPWFIAAFIALIVWSLVWKGMALWKAARLSHKKWFIAFLIINTLGILEIIYVFFVAKKYTVETEEKSEVK